jgi:hypothetical protein
MTCKTQYYMIRYPFWAIFWMAPARDHEGITLDVVKFLYCMCDKLGLRFVCIHYLRNAHVTSFLPFRMFHVPNSCKGCSVLWCKWVNVCPELRELSRTSWQINKGNNQWSR